MKKSYKWLFLVFLLMFFCVNIDGVKAANRKCASDVSIKEVYSCDYSGHGHDELGYPAKFGWVWNKNAPEIDIPFINQDYDTAFSLLMVEDNNGNYCSAAYNPSLIYVDNIHVPIIEGFIGDGSFRASNSEIRSAVKFNLNYSKIFNAMKKGECPNISLTFDALWDKLGHFKGLSDYQIKDSTFSNPVEFVDLYMSSGKINNIAGENWQNLDVETASSWVKFSNPTDEERLEQIKNAANKSEILKIHSNNSSDVSCNVILGNSLSNFLKNFFLILCVVGILACIVLTILDFISLVNSGEDDGFSKNFKKLRIRIILIIVLLLLPMLINWFIDFANNHLYYDTNGKITFGDVSDCLNSNSETVDQSNFSAGAA